MISCRLRWKGAGAIACSRHGWLTLSVNRTLPILIAVSVAVAVTAAAATAAIEWTKVVYQEVVIALDVEVAAAVLLFGATAHRQIVFSVAECAGVCRAASGVSGECDRTLAGVVFIQRVR